VTKPICRMSARSSPLAFGRPRGDGIACMPNPSPAEVSNGGSL